MCAKVADFGFSKYAPQECDSSASKGVPDTWIQSKYDCLLWTHEFDFDTVLNSYRP